MSRRFRLLLVLLVVATALPLATAAGGNGGGASGEHQRILDFWTQERMAHARPRDFVFDPATRQYRPAARPGGGGGGTVVAGASWNGGGAVTGTTGKVFFAMGGSYWVCSASTIADSATNDRSLVLTAGHCVYDETAHQFATMWMFIPDYDSAPAPLTTSGSFCPQTRYGCWTASSLAVHSGYANAGGFNDQAVQHDWGFAVMGLGGKTTALVESVIGTQGYSFSTSFPTDAFAFGYPAEGKWKGNDLIYCRGPVDGDPYTTNDAGQSLTYRMNQCKLNGGSSGGPWMRSFSGSTGTLFSVNSYGYSGVAAMHGPFFNSKTAATYNAALSQTSNTIVSP